MGYLKGIWNQRKGQRGFTLVELLVVIAIIGILATLVLLQLGTARARARDTQRISAVSQLRTAIEQYYDDHAGTYPAALTDVAPTYIAKEPKDPLDGSSYCYAIHAASPPGYVIWTVLEQNAAALKNDSDIVDGKTLPTGFTMVTNTGRCDSAAAKGSATDDAAACGTAGGPAAFQCVYDQGVQ